MSILAGDPLTQLAFSVYENKGVFAVVLGSGLSRAAEIPTGWEITLDLIRRAALAQGIEDQTDWAAWYRKTAGEEPSYSRLLEELASSPEERRSILHSYIEPSDEDREAGRKIPTAAHNAIAELVRSGYIRVIVTTNFDRLMENALRERGIEPTIVSSVDALSGAEPITHSACYILKLHGDYKDARILNTEAELSGYPKQYDTLLDRIMDEHGLIVCGWSGEWDSALRAAFLRAPNRRYSVFWASRGNLGSGAQTIVDHRRARVIAINDADNFFRGLQQRVETLEQSKRQNPFSIELLVSSAKRFLAKPEYRIQMDELFAQEADRLLAQLGTSEFEIISQGDADAFRSHVRSYEAATEALTCMVGVLARWGDDTEFSLVLDIIQSLYTYAKRPGGGSVRLLNLRSYPAVLIFTAYGLGLTRATRWAMLHRMFNAKVDQQYGEPQRLIDVLFLNIWDGDENEAFKNIEGFEKRKTALSDHLLTIFLQWAKTFVGLTPNFELMFERFEILGSLANFEQYSKARVKETLQGDPRNGWEFMAFGRAAWDGKNRDKILSEMQTDPFKLELVRSGFAQGDPEFIDLFAQNFARVAARVRWQ
ncbi:SIR2 family protein [Mesorhizobium loti]|uniref:Uncharacterized protein n=2 Tax=Rhizobium loti TaxID=381 RepID=A0A6M7X2V5_RHILI|nr:SIR2 family protein [Mesorhizobium loti]QKD06438.1 hypothetical protein EB235_19815 [Mesorhizobium loti R88b]